ncbi:tRNA-splicing endonuclease subunit [Didymosphaeria variabile]|uniref:tRNA-splicing endonuclease subunit Sen34 n=1 Tax=Didymosphaeria variabile TaxID=1932322 RepID=A0A9W9C9M9_9PLEO|nr:tRNA-splicing endonuclease subunit [Didymosphaeria variabile]KAJ4351535.1 tRNA-splicing endonuclease subunit [Didymosphaeria variabile]
MAPDTPPDQEPFPISYVAGRYLLFDPPTVAYARRRHNVIGVLIGTIPNLSQQNVFLGIPLELQPEEARVLVEQGHAYIVDDAAVHRDGFLEMSREDRLAYLRDMDEKGAEISREVVRRAKEKSEQALREKGLRPSKKINETTSTNADSSLFDADEQTGPVVKAPEKRLEPTYITPTTSYPPLSRPQPSHALGFPEVPKSFPLFRYLHGKGYFMMPGLRFGCHYSVYPGDPLRFHSHFLATGLGWDEEFDLLDIVGGGRLGTGVKKAYLIGGEEKGGKKKAEDILTLSMPSWNPALRPNKEDEKKPRVDVEPVRAFSIEWAGL